MILEANGLSMDFGGLRAVDRVDITIEQGEIVALIGPNGAGKTTFFNCVTGMYLPTEGEVTIAPPEAIEQNITGFKPDKIAERGLARTFQNIRLFPNMTVLENVMIGRDCRLKRSGSSERSCATGSQREEEERSSTTATRSCGRSGSSGTPTTLRRTCPTARSGASRSRERSRPSRSSCCSTSRPRA